MESAKQAFAARTGSGNLHFCMRYFSKTKNKTAEKITGQCFPLKSRVTCKNLTDLAARKERPKKSLTLFMHAHLQLFYYDIDLPNFWTQQVRNTQSGD